MPLKPGWREYFLSSENKISSHACYILEKRYKFEVRYDITISYGLSDYTCGWIPMVGQS
jgi:hypothetical protein